MPIWVPFAVAVIGMALAVAAGRYFGSEAERAAITVAIIGTSIAVVLVAHPLLDEGQIPAWAQWMLLLAPWVAAAVVVLWPRAAPAPRQPSARCARCDADLYLDHTGRDRYYCLTNGYLCPPALRIDGDRRHRPVPMSRPLTEPALPSGTHSNG